MGVVVGIVLVAGAIWFIFFAKQRTTAVINNVLSVLLFGGIGLALLASGALPLLAIGMIAYALWGVYQTILWFTDQPDSSISSRPGPGQESAGASRASTLAPPRPGVTLSNAGPLTPPGIPAAEESDAGVEDRHVAQVDWSGLSPRTREVGELLARRPGLDFQQMADELQCERQQISEAIVPLQQRSWVERRRGGTYALKVAPPSAQEVPEPSRSSERRAEPPAADADEPGADQTVVASLLYPRPPYVAVVRDVRDRSDALGAELFANTPLAEVEIETYTVNSGRVVARPSVSGQQYLAVMTPMGVGKRPSGELEQLELLEGVGTLTFTPTLLIGMVRRDAVVLVGNSNTPFHAVAKAPADTAVICLDLAAIYQVDLVREKKMLGSGLVDRGVMIFGGQGGIRITEPVYGDATGSSEIPIGSLFDAVARAAAEAQLATEADPTRVHQLEAIAAGRSRRSTVEGHLEIEFPPGSAATEPGAEEDPYADTTPAGEAAPAEDIAALEAPATAKDPVLPSGPTATSAPLHHEGTATTVPDQGEAAVVPDQPTTADTQGADDGRRRRVAIIGGAVVVALVLAVVALAARGGDVATSSDSGDDQVLLNSAVPLCTYSGMFYQSAAAFSMEMTFEVEDGEGNFGGTTEWADLDQTVTAFEGMITEAPTDAATIASLDIPPATSVMWLTWENVRFVEGSSVALNTPRLAAMSPDGTIWGVWYWSSGDFEPAGSFTLSFKEC